MCAASSSNTFTKTFSGIDGAGKRLADEVSLQIFAKTSLKILDPFVFNIAYGFVWKWLNLVVINRLCKLCKRQRAWKGSHFWPILLVVCLQDMLSLFFIHHMAQVVANLMIPAVLMWKFHKQNALQDEVWLLDWSQSILLPWQLHILGWEEESRFVFEGIAYCVYFITVIIITLYWCQSELFYSTFCFSCCVQILHYSYMYMLILLHYWVLCVSVWMEKKRFSFISVSWIVKILVIF